MPAYEDPKGRRKLRSRPTKRPALMLAALATLWCPGPLLAQSDSLFLRTTDTSSQVPRLVVTTSAGVGSLATVRIETSRFVLGSNAILQLGTYNPGTPSSGDLRYSGGSVLYYNGSGWDTITTTGTAIQNQSASNQSASYRISGTAQIYGSAARQIDASTSYSAGTGYAIYAAHTGAAASTQKMGVYGSSTGGGAGALNIGVYGYASGATSNWGGLFEGEYSTSATPESVLAVSRMTSAAAANGIGSTLEFRAEDTGGTWNQAASVSGILTTATAGSEAGALAFSTLSGGALAERMRIRSDGMVVPGADDSYDLGTTTLRWQDIYLSGQIFNSGGNRLYLLKDATDSSSAAVAAGWLYSFTNSSGSAAGGLSSWLSAASNANGDHRALYGRSSTGDNSSDGLTLQSYGVIGRVDGASTLAGAITANFAVAGEAAGTSATGTTTNYALYGLASGANATTNYGAWVSSQGVTTGTNYGLYASASGGATNWAGFFNAGDLRLVNGIMDHDYTGTATAYSLTANSVTAGTLFDVSATGLTSGQGFRLSGPTGVSTMTGRLVYATGDIGNSGALFEASGTFRGGAGEAYGAYVGLTNAASASAPDLVGLRADIADDTTTGADNYGVEARITHTGVTAAATTYNYAGYFYSSKTLTGATGTAYTYGVYGQAVGDANGTSYAYGVYGTASGADTNWAGYFSGPVYMSGEVDRPAMDIAFMAWNTADDAVASGWFKAEFDGEDFDSGGDFSTVNDRFTAPATGVYMFTAGVALSSLADLDRWSLALYVNGGTKVNIGSGYASGTGGFQVIRGSAVLSLTAGDYVEVYFYTANATTTVDGNATLDAWAYTNFSGHRVY
ncbi:MAG: hypothetical protein HY720_23195 [Planctomycetes bacterium]|nr:hypothetical protein [Planctomycetota bacterium]